MGLLIGCLYGAASASAVWLLIWRRVALDLAHEVRRPMTALLLAAEGVRSHLEAGELDALIRQVKQASATLDQSDALSRLLARTRRQAGGATEPLAHAIASTVAAWAPAARSDGRQIRLRHGLPDMAVRHTGAVTGALSNLIANALEHGSGDVTVTSVAGSGGRWALEVANDEAPSGSSPWDLAPDRLRGRGERIAASEVRRLGGEMTRWTPSANLARLEFGHAEGTR